MAYRPAGSARPARRRVGFALGGDETPAEDENKNGDAGTILDDDGELLPDFSFVLLVLTDCLSFLAASTCMNCIVIDFFQSSQSKTKS